MTYWHIQMYKDREENEEERLLTELSIVGIGDLGNNDISVKQFKQTIKIGDIALVRRGKRTISLVEIIGELEDSLEDDYNRLDWFRYRRKIKVLDWANDMESFPQAQGSLQRLVNQETKSYKYIADWHKKISPSFYQKKEGLTLNKIYIQKYKMFNEFNLNFHPLITVIAGINGSGKTTLLEYINDFSTCISNKDDDKSLIELKMYNEKIKEYKEEVLNYLNYFEYENINRERVRIKSLQARFFEKSIEYFPTGTDITNIKEFMSKYIENIIHKEDLKPSIVHDRIREYIEEIFHDLDLMIEFDSRDSEGNLFFRRDKSKEIFSIDNISTGEKTLISKILYLYLKEIKNKVILIDEPELSLHPSWQNQVLKLYTKFADNNNCQIIIATHSPHIIGSAKNEYIRILTEDGVINDVLAYGRDIEWVLEEVMGAKFTREQSIENKIKECQELLTDDKYDEAEKLIDALEKIIGANDSEILAMRNDISFWRD